MKVIDLFCGCGGFSEGFKQAGFEVLFGVDNNQDACDSYAANHGKSILSDVRKLDLDLLKEADVIIGSPPCQSFSEANPNRENKPDLVLYFLYLMYTVKPKYWIMEEVEEVKKWLPPSIPRQVFQANYSGLNHRQRRLFAGYYPQIMASAVHPCLFGTPTSKWKASGNFHADYPKDIVELRGHDPDIEDKKRDMGFPLDYKLIGSEKSQHLQLGNAVCPSVSKLFADAIKEDVFFHSFDGAKL
jgi:site-specific DNA-cytosine methylase